MTSKLKVFVSTPMSAFPDTTKFADFRGSVLVLLRALRRQIFVDSVYCALERTDSPAAFTSPRIAAEQDLYTLRRSHALVFIYPVRTPTSALIELGYAIAMKWPIIVCTPSRESLPFMVREIDHIETNVKMVISSELPSDEVIDLCRSFVVA